MIVNTASQCNFTFHYQDLQKLYDRYKDKGFVQSETIIKWGEDLGLKLIKQVQLPPYHFGIIFEK